MTERVEYQTNIQAPLTFADLLYRSRLVVFIIAVAILAFVFMPRDDMNIIRGVIGYLAGTTLTYYIIVFREGLVIDSSGLEFGVLNAFEAEESEFNDLCGRTDAVLLPSKGFGKILLLGGRYFTGEVLERQIVVGESIYTEQIPVATAVRSHLELCLNARLLNGFKDFSTSVIPRWQDLERNFEFEVMNGVRRRLEWIRQSLGLTLDENSIILPDLSVQSSGTTS